mmetsp:Transcript_12890/g.12979  ORF Transcript_12890/g.12979 Transcript_12890/m.12979 type:complete len:142 (+) Transcript_12890:7-432(+)
MSADLQWAILRNHSSFLVRKRKGTQGDLTSEPGNLTQINSFKFSGLANTKTVGLTVENKKVVLTTKKLKGTNKPKSANSSSQLNKHMVGGSCRAAETINKLVSGNQYRADLAKFAVARYHALHKSLETKPAPKKRRVAKQA